MEEKKTTEKKLYSILGNRFLRVFVPLVVIQAILLYRGISHVSLTTWDYVIIGLILLFLFTDGILHARRTRIASGEEFISLKERLRRLWVSMKQNSLATVAIVFAILFFTSVILIILRDGGSVSISGGIFFILIILLLPFVSSAAALNEGNTPVRNYVDYKKNNGFRWRRNYRTPDKPSLEMKKTWIIAFIVSAIVSYLSYMDVLPIGLLGLDGGLLVYYGGMIAMLSFYNAVLDWLLVRFYRKNPDQYERDLALYISFFGDQE